MLSHPGLFLDELMAAVGARDFQLSCRCRRSELLAASWTGKYLPLQRFFNPLRIETHNELSVDLESGNPHDLMGHQGLSCFRVL